MKHRLLNDYLLDTLESLVQNLSVYTKDKKPESLHQLRLDIKKVKAIFSFAECVFNEKYDLKAIKQLFLKAGKLREMHINIQLLISMPNPPQGLIAQLKKKEKILIQQFIKRGSGNIMLLRGFKDTVCLPETQLRKKAVVEYFKKEENEASKILRKKDRGSMHRYRKKIKKVYFIFKALPKRMQKNIELNEEEINYQQKKLGDWHDTYSAINFLFHEPLPINTSEYILKLKKKEKRQFNALLRNLR